MPASCGGAEITSLAIALHEKLRVIDNTLPLSGDAGCMLHAYTEGTRGQLLTRIPMA